MILKILIGVIVIGGGLGYFTFQAMQSSWSYYYSVDEFSANISDMNNYSFRIAGRVKPGSVNRDLQKMNLTFTLAGTKTEIPVLYEGTVPDNFTDDIEVVVEGRLDENKSFKAKTLMTKCESKYKAKVE
ncbi:MAG: cytochrome c maturation protein CcmE [Planctomycetes bacterium]|nr:cytochrome c maturation protein CcmE [Planctomycetota bacterium]MBL7143575.1 cytochrome c maturation protein CcmE [Phycisphaerae bacterium]